MCWERYARRREDGLYDVDGIADPRTREWVEARCIAFYENRQAILEARITRERGRQKPRLRCIEGDLGKPEPEQARSSFRVTRTFIPSMEWKHPTRRGRRTA